MSLSVSAKSSGEVEGYAVVRSDDQEPAEPRRRGQAEYLGQEGCRLPLIAAGDDRVIKLHAHSRSFLADAVPVAILSKPGRALNTRGRLNRLCCRCEVRATTPGRRRYKFQTPTVTW